MANFYPFLISSLPTLHFAADSGISREEFLSRCRDSIPTNDYSVIDSLINAQSACAWPKIEILRKWCSFETMLRNEIVKLRATRRKIDPAKYLRSDGAPEQHVAHLVLASFRAASPLEGELALDQALWQYLDTLSAGHFFDLEVLVVYALKLQILWRWENIRASDPKVALQKLV